MLTSETVKTINKGHIMNHSKEFGRIEKCRHIGKSTRKLKCLVPTCLDMGKRESGMISRNCGLLMIIFEGKRSRNIFGGRDMCKFGRIKLELIDIW